MALLRVHKSPLFAQSGAALSILGKWQRKLERDKRHVERILFHASDLLLHHGQIRGAHSRIECFGTDASITAPISGGTE